MNNKQTKTHPEKTNLKKLPQIQPLQLEQLEQLAGGIEHGQGTVECPACVVN